MSIFALKQSVSELSSSNMGTSRMTYEQIQPTRDIIGTSFPNGQQHWRFELAGNKWWIPNRSYFRIRARLSGPLAAGPIQPNKADDVSYKMNWPSSLYNSMEFRIANKVVDRIDNYVPQIDTLKKRMNKSKAFMDGYGKTAYMMHPKFEDRQRVTAVDGDAMTRQESQRGTAILEGTTTLSWTLVGTVFTFALPATLNILEGYAVGDQIVATVNGNTLVSTITAVTATTIVVADPGYGADVVAAAGNIAGFNMRKIQPLEGIGASADRNRSVREVEAIWTPPLSIFDLSHGLPVGKYELVMNPQQQAIFKKQVIESLVADKAQVTDFDFEIVDMFFYIATLQGPRVDTMSYLLDLDQVRLQIDNVDNNVSLQQKRFDVHESTNALTLTFQDNRVLSDTRFSNTLFKADQDSAVASELDLNRMFLNYAAQSRPSPDADVDFSVGDARDYTVQRYNDTQTYLGSVWDTGSPETIQDWHNRGAYYYFIFAKDGHDRSVRATVNYQFSRAPVNRDVLLFDHYKRNARIMIENGRVIEVQTETA